MTLCEQNNLQHGDTVYFPEIIREPWHTRVEYRDGHAWLRAGTCLLLEGKFIRTLYKEGPDLFNWSKKKKYKYARLVVRRRPKRASIENVPMKICFKDKEKLRKALEKEIKGIAERAMRRGPVPANVWGDK